MTTLENMPPLVPASSADNPIKPWPIGRLLLGLLGFAVFLILVQHGVEDEWRIDLDAGMAVLAAAEGEWRIYLAAGMAVLAAAGAWQLYRARKTLFDTFTSSRFGAACLTAIAVGTALGTFVTQHATDEFLEQHYGPRAAAWIDRLFLAETFHSFWFSGLLALLVCSLLLTILRRPFWRMANWGFLLGHGGMVVVVVGAAIGSRWGVHGLMALHKGQSRNAITLTDEGARGGPVLPLDFALRLDDFQVEKYPDELRFCLYQRGKQSKLLQTVKLEQARDWTPLCRGGLSLRVREYLPASGEPKPARHSLAVGDAPPFEVQVGQTYAAPGTGRSFKVVEFLPDFVYDIEKKRAASAGNEPRNPALLIEEPVPGKGNAGVHQQWLFAKMPGHGQKEGDLALKYTYVNPGRVPSVTIEVRKKGENGPSGEATLLAEEHGGVCILSDDLALVFENKPGEPRSYRSKVSVLEGGQAVQEATIAVNAPLSYGGYEFYQSDWHKEDLNYSGLKVVRDPGLGVVYAGMIMLSLGVCFVFYVRPRLAQAAGGKGR